MFVYRHFRNFDPPALASLWNEVCSAFPLVEEAALENWLFARLWFQPTDLRVALVDERIIGFVLSGISETPEKIGIICFLMVHPDWQRKGVGSELLHQAENSLIDRGVTEIRFGAMAPENPFGFGIYGGSNSPGILISEVSASDFLLRSGYTPCRQMLILQRPLEKPIQVVDSRFAGLHRRTELLCRIPEKLTGSAANQFGLCEPMQFALREKKTDRIIASVLVREVEVGADQHRSVGLLNLHVLPEMRRQGVGKLLLSQLLRHLQEQYSGVVENQVEEENLPARNLLTGLGFAVVNRGITWTKS